MEPPYRRILSSTGNFEAHARRQQRLALREEASRLAADAGDRRELTALAADLDTLTPTWPEE